MSFVGAQIGPWDTISSVKVNDLHSVIKYRSPDTGLELVHAHIDGPIINAYCLIAQKCDDNCGIPHVLQHMIWHGSRRWPSPGLLHRIANKCLSICPTASVEKDHSCYQFTSIGKQGFAMFLPVFFDHVFNPLLQETAFITNVYHIDGSGRDGGACFNAMKEKENNPNVLSTLSLFQLAFGPNSGYSTNHNGVSAYFRSECNLEKVRQFHENFYHASNCCLVVVGGIGKEDLFRALAPVLQHLLRCKRVKPTWMKPWLEEPLAVVQESIIQQIEYPHSFIEKPMPIALSQVQVGILGPPSTENLDCSMAMRLVLEYLMNGPISSAMASSTHSTGLTTVQNDKFADGLFSVSTSVSYTVYEFKQSMFIITFTNVTSDMAPNIPQILRKVMIREFKKNIFKIRKMTKIIQNFYQTELNNMENMTGDQIITAVIPDFLYSLQDNDIMFDSRLNAAYTIHNFLSQNAEFWKRVIQKYFLDVQWVTTLAVPSQQLFDRLQTEMDERIQWRMESTNIKYIKRWTQKLRAASKIFLKIPPMELVNKYSMPSSESIGLINIIRQDNPAWTADTLCNLYIDNINTNYAYLTIIMDTSELQLEHKKYLAIFAEAILHSPYMDNCEKFHTSKEFQREIRRDIIYYETCFGLEWMGEPSERNRFMCGNFPHLLCLRLQMQITKVKEGFYWAKTLLWNTKWQAERLKEVAAKLLKNIDVLQCQGGIVTRALMTDFLYHMNSTPKCVSLVRQKFFLRQLVEELPKSIRKVSKILESIRTSVLRPENITIHLSTNINRMGFYLTQLTPDSRFVISELFRTTFNYTNFNFEYETKRIANSPDSVWMKNRDCVRRFCPEQIYPMADTNVGYMLQSAPGVLSYSDMDYPLLLVALQYFIQEPDGPLYKGVVLHGLAESLDIVVSTLEGLIYFELRGCPDITSAYIRTVDLISRHILGSKDGEGDVPGYTLYHWDHFLLHSAKRQAIFKLAQLEHTPKHMSMVSLSNYYKGLTINFSRQIMNSIMNASMKQVQSAARRYFCPLFLQPTPCFVTAPCDRMVSIIEDLMQRCGKKLSITPPLEQSALASFVQ